MILSDILVILEITHWSNRLQLICDTQKITLMILSTEHCIKGWNERANSSFNDNTMELWERQSWKTCWYGDFQLIRTNYSKFKQMIKCKKCIILWHTWFTCWFVSDKFAALYFSYTGKQGLYFLLGHGLWQVVNNEVGLGATIFPHGLRWGRGSSAAILMELGLCMVVV